MVRLELERGIAVGDGTVIFVKLDQREAAVAEIVGIGGVKADRLAIFGDRLFTFVPVLERPGAVGMA
jgi:hypothetical protein